MGRIKSSLGVSLETERLHIQRETGTECAIPVVMFDTPSVQPMLPATDPSAITGLASNAKLTSDEKIHESCRLFESTLLRQVLKDSLKPMIKGYLDESGSKHEVYRYLLVDALADGISRAQSFGFSNALEAQIRQP